MTRTHELTRRINERELRRPPRFFHRQCRYLRRCARLETQVRLLCAQTTNDGSGCPYPSGRAPTRNAGRGIRAIRRRGDRDGSRGKPMSQDARSNALPSKHLRDDEDDNGAEQAATKKHVEDRVLDRSDGQGQLREDLHRSSPKCAQPHNRRARRSRVSTINRHWLNRLLFSLRNW